MKIKLYKPFEHWYHGGTIFLYSDPHFDEYDFPNMPAEEQVKNINSKVGKNDTIIFLGDIGNEEWISNIKGYKVLLLGNHDKGKSNYIKKHYCICNNKKIFESEHVYECEEFNFEYYMDHGKVLGFKCNNMFDEIYDGPLFINEKILLSHERIALPFGINIHGHNHGGVKTGPNYSLCDDKSIFFNVCADVIDYTPVRLDKLIEGAKVTDIHRIAIDRATERKND